MPRQPTRQAGGSEREGEDWWMQEGIMSIGDRIKGEDCLPYFQDEFRPSSFYKPTTCSLSIGCGPRVKSPV